MALLAGKHFQDSRGHLVAHVDFACEHFTNGFNKAFPSFLFHDVSPPASAQNALRIEGLVVHRQDKNSEFRIGSQ